MKKFAKLGAAFALIAILAVMFCFASLPVVGFAEQQEAASDEIETFVKELCEYNAANDKNGAIQHIKKYFNDLVGEDESVIPMRELISPINGKNYFNLEATIKGEDATKQIIVGAHYDAVGEGAGDNACGVAALYETFKTFYESDKKPPYNVVFVAFDGEEEGLLGSNYYVHDYMSEEQIANTLVMFNIDSIAPQGQLYLMCENKRTDLADLILKGQDPHLIREKPYARGTYNELDMSYGYGYYEYVQGSDHTPFRLAGIPTAFFFSGSYYGSWNFIPNEVFNTNKDTFEHLHTYGFVSQVYTVSHLIVDAVLSEDFVAVATNARNQLVNLDLWYNAWWPTIIVGVIMVALVVATILYNRKLLKKAILGTAEIKTQKVFDKPAAEEIFSFKDTNSKQNGDNVDDIFTFKK